MLLEGAYAPGPPAGQPVYRAAMRPPSKEELEGVVARVRDRVTQLLVDAGCLPADREGSEVDMECPRCGRTPMRVVAYITDPPVIRRILKSLGMAGALEPPGVGPPRARPDLFQAEDADWPEAGAEFSDGARPASPFDE